MGAKRKGGGREDANGERCRHVRAGAWKVSEGEARNRKKMDEELASEFTKGPNDNAGNAPRFS